MKLTESIFLVGSGSGGIGLTNPYDCHTYYVDCGSEGILIDAGSGCNSEKIIEQIEGVRGNKPITKLFLTHHHGDHAGGAKDLSNRYGCQVVAPKEETESIEKGDETALGITAAKRAGFYPPDYEFCPCPVDSSVLPGMRISAGDVVIEVFDGAGHSLGGVCYYLKLNGKGILFVGDLLAFHGLISLQNIPGADVRKYSSSVLGLEGLKVDCFFPGHGCFSLSGGEVHITKAIEAFKQLGIPQNAI